MGGGARDDLGRGVRMMDLALSIIGALTVANLGVTARVWYLLGKLTEGTRYNESAWRDIRKQLFEGAQQ